MVNKFVNILQICAYCGKIYGKAAPGAPREAIMSTFSKIHAVKTTDREPDQSIFVMHMHDDYEIYCFLGGDAEYVVEGRTYPLAKGDIILLRRSESHHILFHSRATYKRITVNFSPTRADDAFAARLMRPFNDRPLGNFNRYQAALFPDMRHLHYLDRMCETEDEEERSTYLSVFLLEILERSEEMRDAGNDGGDARIAEILDYINRHLSEQLSLAEISERFYISRSYLERRFKRVMGSSVWGYVIEKRLLLAKELIEGGENPTKIYPACGYSEYTAFYRAYTRRFGLPPSQTPKKKI